MSGQNPENRNNLSMPIPNSIYSIICRHFRSAASRAKRPIFNSVPGKYKKKAIKELDLVTEITVMYWDLGRNGMVNLPHVMRATELHEWFSNRIKEGNYQLLACYAMSDPDEDFDETYRDRLDWMQRSRTPVQTMNKLTFLHGIGFGENALTIKVLAHLHGTGSELQEQVYYLLCAGIVFSKLCAMLSIMPEILSQSPEILGRKLNYLSQDMQSSLQYLDIFPSFLRFNLENQIKPRHKFHTSLTDGGFCAQEYSIASIVATSDKNFVARLHKITQTLQNFGSSFVIKNAL